MHVILRQYSERDLQIIDVVEDQGTFLGIAFLRFEECMWVIAPVTERVEVVRGVVAVVEAEAVRGNIDQSDTRPKVRIRLQIINKGMLAPITNHQSNPHDREREQENE